MQILIARFLQEIALLAKPVVVDSMATAPSIIAPGTFRPDSFIVGVNGGPLSADSDCFEDDFICLVHTALEKVLMQSILPLLSILLCSDVFFFVSNL